LRAGLGSVIGDYISASGRCSLNSPTMCASPCACSFSVADAAVDCSTSAAFCDPVDDFLHRRTGGLHTLRARADAVSRSLNQVLDLARGGRAALRQRAHFARDHGEPAAVFAGSGRFDGGVQREDVGLKRNAVDHADDFGNARPARSPDTFLDYGRKRPNLRRAAAQV
jgi:hypothetical protein